jgi:multidrug resistance efflux pump
MASLFLSGCGLHGKPAVDRQKALAPAHATATPVSAEPRRVVAPGVVEPWGGSVAVSPRESGWISTLVAIEGARVVAGQTLATLDDDGPRAAIELARADLAEAEAALQRTLAGATADEIRAATAEAEASRARAELANRDAARADRLGDDRVISPVEVERARAEARAQAALARAGGAREASLVHGSRKEDRAAARARVAAARARLAVAEAALSRRRLVAPVDGTVLLSRFHPGEYFTAGGAALVIVGDVSRFQIKLEVDEIDALRLVEGAACSIRGDDDRPLASGAVFRLAPQMGRRGLATESPTARADVRVREVFVETAGAAPLVPGQRVWGHLVPSAPLAQSTTERPHVD